MFERTTTFLSCSRHRTAIFAAAAFVASVLLPSTAHANVGIPMLGFAWPLAWLSFVPVFLLEALLARRMLKLPIVRAMKVSAAANLASTLVGIPVIWGLTVAAGFVVVVVVPRSVLNAIGPIGWLLYVPWLPPLELFGRREWLIPLAGIALCVPFFLGSAYLEFLVARRMLPAVSVRDLRTWSLSANGASYLVIVLGLAGLIAWDLVHR